MKSKKDSNPVAKFAKRFNHSAVFKDRKRALKKGDVKHKKQAHQSDSIAA